MNFLERKIIKEDIFDIKFDNLEEIWVIARYCLFVYVKCLFVFGKESKVTNDVKKVWMEFLTIIKEENKLLAMILKSLKLSDYEEIDRFLVELDEVNEETVLYYFNVLDDIEYACDTSQEWKAVRNKKYFDTLIDTDKYKNKISEFSLNISDVMCFLNYPDDFWGYIYDNVYIVDSRLEQENIFYGVNMKMNGDILEDIKVFVPFIVNLETALVCVHEFKHAYDLYNRLGKTIDKEDSLYESDARELEDMFKNEYMPLVYKRTLKRKSKFRGNKLYVCK